jgi:CRP/FNR family transcriptional regulator, cyclic AMP receptor protein
MPSAADDLRRVDLFAELSGRQRRRLAANFREHRFRAGMDIVREGTMSGIGFFVVTAGQAAVSVSGKEVKTLGPGDHFGEIALITRGKRTATVTARTDLHCLEIPFPDFRRFARANPDVTWKLLQHVASLLPSQPVG